MSGHSPLIGDDRPSVTASAQLRAPLVFSRFSTETPQLYCHSLSSFVATRKKFLATEESRPQQQWFVPWTKRRQQRLHWVVVADWRTMVWHSVDSTLFSFPCLPVNHPATPHNTDSWPKGLQQSPWPMSLSLSLSLWYCRSRCKLSLAPFKGETYTAMIRLRCFLCECIDRAPGLLAKAVATVVFTNVSQHNSKWVC